jgi:hypothetical protein
MRVDPLVAPVAVIAVSALGLASACSLEHELEVGGALTAASGVKRYPELRIAQVAYDTPGEGALQKFIELFNPNSFQVSLAGWTFSDNLTSWPFPAVAISAGRFFTVARDRDGFVELYHRSPDVDGLSLFLHKGGDVIELYDPAGKEADMVAWQWFVPGWALYTPAGDSLIRRHPDGEAGLAGDWSVKSPAAPRGGAAVEKTASQ